ATGPRSSMPRPPSMRPRQGPQGSTRIERMEGGLVDAEASLHPLEPGRTLGPLARARAPLGEAHDAARDLEPSPAVRILREALERRRMRLGEALLHAGSVVVDLRATSGHLVPGAEVEVEWVVWNGGSAEVEVLEAAVSVPEGWSVE